MLSTSLPATARIYNNQGANNKGVTLSVAWTHVPMAWAIKSDVMRVTEASLRCFMPEDYLSHHCLNRTGLCVISRDILTSLRIQPAGTMGGSGGSI